MRRFVILPVAVMFFVGLAAPTAPPKLVYEKKDSREATLLATLQASGMPTFEGKWYYVGPFDNAGGTGFDTAYPPEKGVDLKQSMKGKGGKDVAWKEFPDFKVGRIVNLARFKDNGDSVVYLTHEFEVKEAFDLPVSFGSDDTLTVWLNGQEVLARNATRAAAPDQDQATLKLKAGKNRILIKVCNGGGDWAVYLRPMFSEVQEPILARFLERDFPGAGPKTKPGTPEDKYYRIVTLPVPKDCVLEVGGMDFRPDGKLLACTRRGEVWLIDNPGAEDLSKVKFSLFADGLHEALGLHVSGKDVFITQRPELTKLSSKDGLKADEFSTICDKWGVSGDYHEFAFGPARDKEGNFYITLNVGFGGGHQSKAPWRGWCIKVTPKGELIPYATGLRSPNGVSFSPEGDLFYCDNQGEWVATNKMHHIREGEYYGHPAGLRWVTQSPFKQIPDKHVSGMLYDGQKGKTGVEGMPPHVPPCIWFPYGRMGQSASEPRWDTTGGKFGPFAGQCFVGDQCTSVIMRVALEKVNGRYQGACFPFRQGFECGVVSISPSSIIRMIRGKSPQLFRLASSVISRR